MRRQIKGKTASDIIEAAWREFAAGGFYGTRIDQIATAARSNKRMIYHYFENKEARSKSRCSHMAFLEGIYDIVVFFDLVVFWGGWF